MRSPYLASFRIAKYSECFACRVLGAWDHCHSSAAQLPGHCLYTVTSYAGITLFLRQWESETASRQSTFA